MKACLTLVALRQTHSRSGLTVPGLPDVTVSVPNFLDSEVADDVMFSGRRIPSLGDVGFTLHWDSWIWDEDLRPWFSAGKEWITAPKWQASVISASGLQFRGK